MMMTMNINLDGEIKIDNVGDVVNMMEKRWSGWNQVIYAMKKVRWRGIRN